MKGFRAFMTSLQLFLVEMVLVSTEQMNEDIRYPFLAGLACFAGFMFKDWQDIVDKATPIFTGKLPDETDG